MENTIDRKHFEYNNVLIFQGEVPVNIAEVTKLVNKIQVYYFKVIRY